MTKDVADKIVVYSTSWCPDCHRSKRLLDQYAIDYVEIDIDDHPDAVPIVLHVNNGKRKVPTIVFPDGSTLSEPGDRELAAKIGIG